METERFSCIIWTQTHTAETPQLAYERAISFERGAPKWEQVKDQYFANCESCEAVPVHIGSEQWDDAKRCYIRDNENYGNGTYAYIEKLGSA